VLWREAQCGRRINWTKTIHRTHVAWI